MNDGVALLLERMKTNPEEFDAMGRDSKWENLVYKFNEWLDEEDKEIFKNAIKKMRQQKFTELVMEELVDPKKPIGLSQWARDSSITPLVGQTLASSLMTSKAATMATIATANSLTLGSTTINESHLEHLRAHVDALKSEVANQKPKEHKTIFGKLFNYS